MIVAMSDVTRILNQIEKGDPAAAESLLPLVYEELRTLARQRLTNEKPGQTLQATALVHEAYLRLVGKNNVKSWDNRGHFFAAAAEAMRRILVDAARKKQTDRHGGGFENVGIPVHELAASEKSTEVLALHEALTSLEVSNELAARVAKLRYFAGMSISEIAAILNLSPRKVDQTWAYARTFLRTEMLESN